MALCKCQTAIKRLAAVFSGRFSALTFIFAVIFALSALSACSGSGTNPPVLNFAGDWEGLVTGEMGSVEILLNLEQDEHGRVTASLSIPTIPNLDSASGWGRTDGGSISLALTDKAKRGVFLTGTADSLLAELTGQIALADSPDILTFSVFRQ